MPLCLLSPVWPNYRHLAPILSSQLAQHWPGHPPHFFIGQSAWNLRGQWLQPADDPHGGTNWTWSLRDGVKQARALGFTETYLIAEEHVPLALCRREELEVQLPAQARSLGASYVSLMGWDNRRFCSKSPRLTSNQRSWMHLTSTRDPRFHLHPAWWDLAVLEACCELALRNSAANGSAWHFEKTCGLASADLPVTTCYQICASADVSGYPSRPALVNRWFYNRLMAMIPLLPPPLRLPYYHAIRFDDVFCVGPYPMIFSGLLAKGEVNPALRRRQKSIENADVIMKTLKADTL